MNIKISSLHFDADKKLLDFVDKKINKLVKFYEDIIGAEVTLRVEKNQDQENKITEIRLVIPGNDLFVKKQSKSFEEAIDIAVEALRQQIVKHKEKLRGV
jgi:putative sigma-54 modulation protein